MRKAAITVNLSQSQLREEAMMRSGLNPKAMSMRRGSQVQRDRRAEDRRGHSKHKSRMYD